MKARFYLRPEVAGFVPYSPGLSIEEIQERYSLDTVIKMASNENPLGASPLVQKRICEAAGSVFRYAQSGTPKLAQALGNFLRVDPTKLVLGNGSDEVIDLLIRACPTPGVHNIVACQPCFSLYKLQSKLCGTEFRAVPLQEDFSFHWQGLLDAVDENTALVFITTPDNPSGYCPPREEVEAFANALPAHCLLIIDEAYIDFCDDMQKYSLFNFLEKFPQVVLLRTFSKRFGLAGIRLGYGLMPVALAKALCSIRPPFSVNILAEIAGLAALEDTVFYQKTLDTVWKGRSHLTTALSALGCHVYPSQANFLMFKLPAEFTLSAQEVFTTLLEQGCIIRPLTSYGLPQHLRVSIGTEKENTRFLELLSKALAV